MNDHHCHLFRRVIREAQGETVDGSLMKNNKKFNESLIKDNTKEEEKLPKNFSGSLIPKLIIHLIINYFVIVFMS